MARSGYIYTVYDCYPDDTVAYFTVKHEALSFIAARSKARTGKPLCLRRAPNGYAYRDDSHNLAYCICGIDHDKE